MVPLRKSSNTYVMGFCWKNCHPKPLLLLGYLTQLNLNQNYILNGHLSLPKFKSHILKTLLQSPALFKIFWLLQPGDDCPLWYQCDYLYMIIAKILLCSLQHMKNLFHTINILLPIDYNRFSCSLNSLHS